MSFGDKGAFFHQTTAPAARRLKGLIGSLLLLPAALFAAEGIDIPDEKPFLSPPAIRLVGQTLYFDGLIQKESASVIEKMLRSGDVSRISVNSMGGDTASALTIGALLQRKKLDLVVRTVCASACANYLFPAAYRKYIGPESYLLWHGGINSPPSQFALDLHGASLTREAFFQLPDVKALQRRERRFYQRIGVNEKMPFCPQLEKNYQHQFPEKWFSYTPAALEQLGVRRVVYQQAPVQWVSAMKTRHVVFARPCR